MDKKILWILLHPPRTAGNTIIEVLLKKFPRDEIFMSSIARYEPNPEKINKDKVRFMMGHATYYGIHKLVPNKIPRYFTILRDPAERLVSHYNMKIGEEGKKIPFEKWYKNQIKNELVHFLDLKYKGSGASRIRTPNFLIPLIRKFSYKTTYHIQTIIFNILGLNKKNDFKKLENAKKLLDLCWFVGVSEKSDEDFRFLLDAMGLKGVKWINDGASKPVFKLNKELRKKIYEENPLDFEIYKYALKLRKEKLKKLKKIKGHV